LGSLRRGLTHSSYPFEKICAARLFTIYTSVP
jgi:hypothetical protein